MPAHVRICNIALRKVTLKMTEVLLLLGKILEMKSQEGVTKS